MFGVCGPNFGWESGNISLSWFLGPSDSQIFSFEDVIHVTATITTTQGKDQSNDTAFYLNSFKISFELFYIRVIRL